MKKIKTKKIIIADDELFIRLIVRNVLEKEYIIIEATNGEEVIELARQHKPNLILMDIMMPRLDGVRALHLLKSDPATRNIQIVMLSARTDALDQKYSQEMGADGYLPKPFSLDALLTKVKQYDNATCTTGS